MNPAEEPFAMLSGTKATTRPAMERLGAAFSGHTVDTLSDEGHLLYSAEVLISHGKKTQQFGAGFP